MRVAVAGGTGLVGRYVVEELESAGQEAVVLARSRGVDLLTGTGLDEAVEGVESVIDVSNLTTTSAKKSIAFFEPATHNLLRAGERAGVRHHVVLSVVGVDRVGLGYYKGKLRQEELVKDGPLPWTVLRATQLHEFAQQTLGQVPGPVAVVPRMRTQPVAAKEVAQHLVRLALAAPLGATTELAGPQIEQLVDMARRLLRAQGRSRLVLPVPLPGATGAAMRGDGQLPTGPHARGEQTFEAWLSEHTV
ncbi:SDR family oxidoreductase [Streptomyces sp. NPDC086010]|uniref:SDR family oxidoreductase n=1 Tax=Streptomyces sp. NPDC086010 TaxID=3365745 RepID=UPI0037D76765